MKLVVNGSAHEVDVPRTCRSCGCCAMSRPDGDEVRLRHRAVRRLHGAPRRRARALVRAAGGTSPAAAVTTIEGLAPEARTPCSGPGSPRTSPQCGYCQSGQIMSAVALLEQRRRRATRTSTRRCREHLPLRHVPAHPRRRPPRRRE